MNNWIMFGAQIQLESKKYISIRACNICNLMDSTKYFLISLMKVMYWYSETKKCAYNLFLLRKRYGTWILKLAWR